MRRLLAWTSAALGVAWILRRLRRRKAWVPAPVAAGDPAEDLRRKLAETRPEEPEEAPAPPAAPDVPLDDRRRAVHDRARAAIDDMKSAPPDPE